ncbi:MAG: phosphatidylserine decarboxylase family protein [Nitrospirae bacterium]|nr:MAG: phosphatidylserine decarboxylase family protein [Nitrospirota bacterium]
MIRFAPEGYPFIIISGLISVTVAVWPGPLYAVVPIITTAFMLYFFRDPERVVPDGKDIFVSPADGKIIVIRDVQEDRHLHVAAKQISIFMSPLNVHVNRAPCDGKVKSVRHNAGRFLAAYKDEASIRNENIEMVLESVYGDILVRQVAGFVARRAVCRVKEGYQLMQGERYGIIKFSSRLDVYLPKDAMIKVKLGDSVRAGETLLAQAHSEPK